VNWPYDCEDAVMTSRGGDELEMSSIFEKHVRRLENWTVSPVFEAHYPELKGFVAGSKKYRT
jgi:hypothetical protein